MTVVYLSNQNVQVLVGEEKGNTLAVQNIYETQVPEECLINGVVTDERSFSEALGNFWKQHNLAHKDVRLVVNSSQFAVKMLELPKMRGDHVQEILKKEFLDVDRKQDPLFGYHVFGRTKTSMRILATAVERSFINNYLQLFGTLGIEVSTVHAALECAVRFLHNFARIQSETCIVQLVDDNNLTSILWVDGRFENTSRARLFSDSGTEGFGGEISRTVSHLLQFYSSLKREDSIRDIYIGGLNHSDLPYYVQGVEALGLQVQALTTDSSVSFASKPAGKETGDYVFLLGALLETKQSFNLVTASQQKDRAAAGDWVKRLLPMGIALVIGLVATGVVWGGNLVQQGQLNAANAYINDAENAKNIQLYDETNRKVADMGRTMNAAEALLDALDTYPKVNSSVTNAISNAAGSKVTTEIKTYDGAEGALTLRATAEKPEDIHGFIAELTGLALFSKVEYSGYTYQEAAGRYDINVVCYLTSDAGK